MVQVCNISGGATMPPKRDAAANAGSMQTGFRSSSAVAQCRIIGGFTRSGATEGVPMGLPIRARMAASAFASLCMSSDITCPYRFRSASLNRS